MTTKHLHSIALGAILTLTQFAIAAPTIRGEYGTISQVDEKKALTFVPWGKPTTEAKTVLISVDTLIHIKNNSAKKADFQPGMWIVFDKVADSGTATEITAGHFVFQEDDKISIFEGLPAEFLTADVKDWYTNEVGGMKFKIQVMRNKTDMAVIGLNLRPANYKEPEGGFLVYWPVALKGAVLNYEGAKPGATKLDGEGRMVITRDTVTESYWKHPKNPNKLDAGYTSGLTEITVRKIPQLNRRGN